MPTSPFLTRVGSRVLPETFSVQDTPSLARFDNREVAGAYAVDDEGVPAQDVTLCEKGVLKTLLTSRTPQKGFLTSNGHGRNGRAQAGVFQLQSSAAVPAATLKEKYLARLKADGREFGYVVRTLGSGGPNPGDVEEMMMSAMIDARRPVWAGDPARLQGDRRRHGDAGPWAAVRQRAARRLPRHSRGVRRAQHVQLPSDAAVRRCR